MIAKRLADVAVLIVGFRNPTDLNDCLAALSIAAVEPHFNVFICENGGIASYKQVLKKLLAPQGPCQLTEQPRISNLGRFLDIRCLRLRARPSNVWVGCASDNLGYAGGINAWLHELQFVSGWKGVWILNPDTEPEPDALAALVERAETGKKGMVGSTLLSSEKPNEIRLRGLLWHRLTTRVIPIGIGEPLDAPHDLAATEAVMDSPCGASMYVTRGCIDKIGFMDESYFLFYEELDWGIRAKSCGLGYAPRSIVWHKQGTTTGSEKSLAERPRLLTYLQHRNGIHFTGKYFPWTLPIRIAVSFLHAARFLTYRAPGNFATTLEGTLAGLRGENGRPNKYYKLAESPGITSRQAPHEAA